MEILQEVWKQRLRPRAVVGYGVEIFLPSPPKYVTRSPGLPYQNEVLHIWLARRHHLNYSPPLNTFASSIER